MCLPTPPRAGLWLGLCAGLFLSADLVAHGGQYRGPGSIGLPGNSSPSKDSGPRGTTAASGPAAGQPGSGSSNNGNGGISGPAPSTGSGATTRSGTRAGVGIYTEAIPSEWQDWWEYHKDEFLDLRNQLFAALDGSDPEPFSRIPSTRRKVKRPSGYELQRYAIGTLTKILDQPELGRDLLSGALVAAARIGGSEALRERITSYLANSDQELRETAALALGLLGDARDVSLLISLAHDEQIGRQASQRDSVGYRTRSFACYGLGLALEHLEDVDARTRIAEALGELAVNRKALRPDVRIAALHGLRLFGPKLCFGSSSYLNHAFVYELRELATRKSLDARVAAHAWSVLGPLYGRTEDAPGRDDLLAAMRTVLRESHQAEQLHPSVILAWTEMLRPEDAEEIDLLLNYARDGRSLAARRLATVALGRIGGGRVRAELYRALRSSQWPASHKTWISLSLAVLDHEARKLDPAHETDEIVASAIHEQFRGTRNALRASAHALALGMMRYRPAGADILDRLTQHVHEEEAAGYLALSLGLMRDPLALEPLDQVVDRSRRRPLTQLQAAIALGLMGDAQIAQKLTDELANGKGGLVVKSSLARAIGFIGDAASLPVLAELAGDAKAQTLSRAFAAAAIGILCDRDPMPWGARLARGCNYLAPVETLRNGMSGILDLL
jgi:HEAT repeat protein